MSEFTGHTGWAVKDEILNIDMNVPTDRILHTREFKLERPMWIHSHRNQGGYGELGIVYEKNEVKPLLGFPFSPFELVDGMQLILLKAC